LFVINREVHKKSVDIRSDNESPVDLPHHAKFLFLVVNIYRLLEERRLRRSGDLIKEE